jgi:hypothetical protein
MDMGHDEEPERGRVNVAPSVWGARVWRILYGLARLLDDRRVDAGTFVRLLEVWLHLLPCASCRGHFAQLLPRVKEWVRVHNSGSGSVSLAALVEWMEADVAARVGKTPHRFPTRADESGWVEQALETLQLVVLASPTVWTEEEARVMRAFLQHWPVWVPSVDAGEWARAIYAPDAWSSRVHAAHTVFALRVRGVRGSIVAARGMTFGEALEQTHAQMHAVCLDCRAPESAAGMASARLPAPVPAPAPTPTAASASAASPATAASATASIASPALRAPLDKVRGVHFFDRADVVPVHSRPLLMPPSAQKQPPDPFALHVHEAPAEEEWDPALLGGVILLLCASLLLLLLGALTALGSRGRVGAGPGAGAAKSVENRQGAMLT